MNLHKSYFYMIEYLKVVGRLLHFYIYVNILMNYVILSYTLYMYNTYENDTYHFFNLH